jgi:topoisomerase-4 subunit A
VGVKGFKAKGKRVSTLNVSDVVEIEPLRFPEPEEKTDEVEESVEEENLDPDAGKSQQDVLDELTGQLHLFD